MLPPRFCAEPQDSAVASCKDSFCVLLERFMETSPEFAVGLVVTGCALFLSLGPLHKCSLLDPSSVGRHLEGRRH